MRVCVCLCVCVRCVRVRMRVCCVYGYVYTSFRFTVMNEAGQARGGEASKTKRLYTQRAFARVPVAALYNTILVHCDGTLKLLYGGAIQPFRVVCSPGCPVQRHAACGTLGGAP